MHARRHDLGGRFGARHHEGRTRILTRIAEIHDVFRMRRIAHVEDFQVLVRAALGVPAVEAGVRRLRRARNEVGNAGRAVPPIAVGDILAGYRR